MAELKNCTTKFSPALCGVNVIVDPQKTTSIDSDRALIIGQKSDDGTASVGLHKVEEATRDEMFGIDSMLTKQIDEFNDTAENVELWVYVAENTGTSGTADITISGVDTATKGGIVYLWVNGKTYTDSFDPTNDTNASVASRLQATISATDNTLVATTSGDTINIETKIKGEIGGFLDVRKSYGLRPDQRSSDEITVDINVTKANGNPDLSGLPDVDDGFEFVANPYTDNDSISNVSAYLCSQWSGGANSRAYGVFYGDANSASAFATNTNNALIAFLAINGALTPSFLESVSFGALAYNQLNSKSLEIANSMTGTLMPAMLAVERADEYAKAEKVQLINSGVGYFNTSRNNKVTIGRAVTTYTTADDGSIDLSMQEINKPSQTAYMSKYFRESMIKRFTGYAFRRDGIAVNGKVATLPAVRNYVISLAQALSNRNIIQDLDGFIASADVQMTENGCIAVTVKPEFVEQFCCMNIFLQTK